MPPTDPSETERRPLPAGYRQGIVSAITIFIGFSLTFLRFWFFEAPGDWTPRSIVAAIAIVIPILLEIYALLRSLRLADDDEAEYAKTIRWFVASVIAMLCGVLFAAIVLSSAIDTTLVGSATQTGEIIHERALGKMPLRAGADFRSR